MRGGRGPPPTDWGSYSNNKIKPLSAFTIFCKSLPYSWPKDDLIRRFYLILSIFFLILGSVTSISIPLALKYAVDQLSNTSGPSGQIMVDMKFPSVAIAAYASLRFASDLCGQLRDFFFASVSANTERAVALKTFRHLQNLSLAFHLRRETGSVLRSVSRGAQSFGSLLRIGLFQLAPVFIQVSVVSGYLFSRYEWYYGLIAALTIIVYVIYTFFATNWRDHYRRIMSEKDNEFNQRAIDALLNFETVKFFNGENHEEKRYDSALKEYTDANIKQQRTLAMLSTGQSIIIAAGVFGIMWLSGQQVVNGQITVGDWVMLQSFLLQLYQPLSNLGIFYLLIKQSIIDVESMFRLLSEKNDIEDDPQAKELKLNKGEIEFRNVSFSYSNKIPILKQISFKINSGMKVAIVGPSGAGKSTIARLLYRFYEASSGSILLDGQDIKAVTQKSLRSNIAIVPQDTVLFNDTIGYNIGYGMVGRGDCVIGNQKDIEFAADRARLKEFILKQPQTYNTKVGERGLRLSGGEKQRVSVARAILKTPKIMIFDEATSSLDSQTESLIQSELDMLSKGLTSITIAHRLSTIMNADLIMVLSQGSIVETGTHEHLLKINQGNGLYASMWKKQEKLKFLENELSMIKDSVIPDSLPVTVNNNYNQATSESQGNDLPNRGKSVLHAGADMISKVDSNDSNQIVVSISDEAHSPSEDKSQTDNSLRQPLLSSRDRSIQ